jgi:hypothetical protein
LCGFHIAFPKLHNLYILRNKNEDNSPKHRFGNLKILMQNLGNTDIYMEMWDTATIEDWVMLVKQWGVMAWENVLLDKLNLISNWWGSNNNIRITAF